MFLDFDGTVTAEDSCIYLLRRLAAPGWEQPGQDYRSGRIDGRTCLKREWEMLPHELEVLLAVASEIPIDAGLHPLIDYLTEEGAEAAVLSDGLGFLAEHVIAGRLPVITNSVTGEELCFPHPVEDCPCAGCGVCKPSIVARASARGLVTIVVGDGMSDRLAATVADVVFAKGELGDWCATRHIAHTRFNSLIEIQAALRANHFAFRAQRRRDQRGVWSCQ